MSDKKDLDTKILYVFKNNKGKYLSGEDISNKLGITRSAVWKHIEKLRKAGYQIDAVPHLGYCLNKVPDKLLPDDIKFKLKTKIIGKEIYTFTKTNSTNVLAYDIAEKGAKEGTIIIAKKQDAGKGRLGRTWDSEKGGVYLSCILRPDIMPNEIQEFTLIVALSIVDTIKEVTNLSAKIKWPNDVYIDGKKVSGILLEMKAATDMIDFVIAGIGINVNNPVSLKTATSLQDKLNKKVDRIKFVQNLLRNLEKEYLLFIKNGFKPIRDKIKKHSYTLGTKIKVTSHNVVHKGKAVDIDMQGALILKDSKGKKHRIISGDIATLK